MGQGSRATAALDQLAKREIIQEPSQLEVTRAELRSVIIYVQVMASGGSVAQAQAQRLTGMLPMAERAPLWRCTGAVLVCTPIADVHTFAW